MTSVGRSWVRALACPILRVLRGSVPKNGPIDFASKNHFSLNSADGKGLVPKY